MGHVGVEWGGVVWGGSCRGGVGWGRVQWGGSHMQPQNKGSGMLWGQSYDMGVEALGAPFR